MIEEFDQRGQHLNRRLPARAPHEGVIECRPVSVVTCGPHCHQSSAPGIVFCYSRTVFFLVMKGVLFTQSHVVIDDLENLLGRWDSAGF